MNTRIAVPHLSRCRLAVIAAVLVSSRLFAADPATPTAPDVVELPAVTVFDSPLLPPPEAWRYTEFAGFEVISNATDRSSRHLIRDFDLFRQALNVVWPMRIQSTTSSTLILSARGGRFDQFRPVGSSSGSMETASLFFRDRTRSAIILDMQARTVTLAEDVLTPTGTSNEFEIDTYRQLYREYIRFLMSQVDPRPPAWLEEGMAQMVMAMEFTERWIVFGKIDSSAYATQQVGMGLGLADEAGAAADASSEGAEEFATAGTEGENTVGDQPFNVALSRRPLMSLQKFFDVSHDAPEARNPIGNNLWAKQAYAFVHLCLYGQKGKHQKAFGMFLQRLGKEPPSEALFKECFNMSYAEMQMTLRGYVQYTDHTSATFNAKSGERFTAVEPTFRDATQAEIGRIKGDALALAGHQEAARKEYVAAYLRGERDPKLLAALGLAEVKAGNVDRGRRFLEVAARETVSNPLVYVELTRLKLAEAKASAGESGKLDADQVQALLASALRARKLPPPLPDTYELLAEIWSESATPPTKEQLAQIEEGVRLFPRQSALVYRVAELNVRAGLPDRAMSLASLGLRGAPDAATGQRFEALMISLQRPRPTDPR